MTKARIEYVTSSEKATLYTIWFEGKMNDGVCALPIESGKLRLYCNRLSQQILIAGNGGVKDTKTYNENNELSNCVLVLQRLDKSIKAAIKRGDVIIEETELKGIEEKEFDV